MSEKLKILLRSKEMGLVADKVSNLEINQDTDGDKKPISILWQVMAGVSSLIP